MLIKSIHSYFFHSVTRWSCQWSHQTLGRGLMSGKTRWLLTRQASDLSADLPSCIGSFLLGTVVLWANPMQNICTVFWNFYWTLNIYFRCTVGGAHSVIGNGNDKPSSSPGRVHLAFSYRVDIFRKDMNPTILPPVNSKADWACYSNQPRRRKTLNSNLLHKCDWGQPSGSNL